MQSAVNKLIENNNDLEKRMHEGYNKISNTTLRVSHRRRCATLVTHQQSLPQFKHAHFSANDAAKCTTYSSEHVHGCVWDCVCRQLAEGMVMVLGYLFKNDMQHKTDYCMALTKTLVRQTHDTTPGVGHRHRRRSILQTFTVGKQRVVQYVMTSLIAVCLQNDRWLSKNDRRGSRGMVWGLALNFWCLNPAVVSTNVSPLRLE